MTHFPFQPCWCCWWGDPWPLPCSHSSAPKVARLLVLKCWVPSQLPQHQGSRENSPLCEDHTVPRPGLTILLGAFSCLSHHPRLLQHTHLTAHQFPFRTTPSFVHQPQPERPQHTLSRHYHSANQLYTKRNSSRMTPSQTASGKGELKL